MSAGVLLSYPARLADLTQSGDSLLAMLDPAVAEGESVEHSERLRRAVVSKDRQHAYNVWAAYGGQGSVATSAFAKGFLQHDIIVQHGMRRRRATVGVRYLGVRLRGPEDGEGRWQSEQEEM